MLPRHSVEFATDKEIAVSLSVPSRGEPARSLTEIRAFVRSPQVEPDLQSVDPLNEIAYVGMCAWDRVPRRMVIIGHGCLIIWRTIIPPQACMSSSILRSLLGREWKGQMQRVAVAWNGKTYRSLSEVA